MRPSGLDGPHGNLPAPEANNDVQRFQTAISGLRDALDTAQRQLAEVMALADTARAQHAAEPAAAHLSQGTQDRLLRGDNVGSKFPIPDEIKRDIKGTLTRLAGNWIYTVRKEGKALGLVQPDTVPIVLLPQLFFICRNHIKKCHRRHECFFYGKGDGVVESTMTGVMEPGTASFMREHLRRHSQTLFPLSGAVLERTYQEVVRELANHPSCTIFGVAAETMVTLINKPIFKELVTAYLAIIVNVILQHPPARFTGDCGQSQQYDDQAHSNPIDSDRATDKCTVVFPALLKDGQTATEPLTQRFVLAIKEEGNTR